MGGAELTTTPVVDHTLGVEAQFEEEVGPEAEVTPPAAGLHHRVGVEGRQEGIALLLEEAMIEDEALVMIAIVDEARGVPVEVEIEAEGEGDVDSGENVNYGQELNLSNVQALITQF
jgi:hypothetical protein